MSPSQSTEDNIIERSALILRTLSANEEFALLGARDMKSLEDMKLIGVTREGLSDREHARSLKETGYIGLMRIHKTSTDFGVRRIDPLSHLI